MGLAAAAVLALFVFVRGFGPEASSGTLGPQRVQASVVVTVPQVPEEFAAVARGGRQDRAVSGSGPRSRPVAAPAPAAVEPNDPAGTALARVSLGRDRVRPSLAIGWADGDGWVEPVRLGGDWSRSSIRRASLVRPISAVMPAPWNVDQAVSLP